VYIWLYKKCFSLLITVTINFNKSFCSCSFEHSLFPLFCAGADLNDVSFTDCLPKLVHGSRDNSRQQCSSSGSSNVSSRNASMNASVTDRSLSESWSFYTHINGRSSNMSGSYPSVVRNPNKAVCTVDAKTSQVGKYRKA